MQVSLLKTYYKPLFSECVSIVNAVFIKLFDLKNTYRYVHFGWCLLAYFSCKKEEFDRFFDRLRCILVARKEKLTGFLTGLDIFSCKKGEFDRLDWSV